MGTKRAKSADACQTFCQEAYDKGCRFYIWKKCSNDCEMFATLNGLETDKGSDGNCLGSVHGCFAAECTYAGFDFQKKLSFAISAIQSQGIYGVRSIEDCLEICKMLNDCAAARLDTYYLFALFLNFTPLTYTV